LARHLPISDDRERFAAFAAEFEQDAERLEDEAARRPKRDGDPSN
jgi:hypothetical protein